MKNMMSFIISFGLHPVSPTWVSLQSKRETRSLKGQTRPPFSMAPGDLSTYPHTTASNPYNNHTHPLPEIDKNKYTHTNTQQKKKLYINNTSSMCHLQQLNTIGNKSDKHKIPSGITFQSPHQIPPTPQNPVIPAYHPVCMFR